MKLSDVGEVKVIEYIMNLVKDVYPNRPLPHYDDAVALKVGSSWVIIKIDGTSSSSSKYPWMSWSDFSYRVALGTVTDIISKGGRPLGLSVSVGVPKDFTVNDVLEIMRGVKELVIKVNAKVLGGDINASNTGGPVWIDVSGIGITDKPIPNNEFREGDIVRVNRCLGPSAIEALTYYGNLSLSDVRKYMRLPFKPDPPTNFLKIYREVTAATDISDGLLSLTKVLERLGLDLVLSDDPPLCDEVRRIIGNYDVEVVDLLRFLGEEFAIVFNDPHNSLDPYPILGKVRRGRGRIIYRGRAIQGGWDNFKGFKNV